MTSATDPPRRLKPSDRCAPIDATTDATTELEGELRAALGQQVQHMMIAVEAILRAHPEGLSELALIKSLQSQPWQLFGKVDFSNPARLYPVHFLTFHVLYRLREELGEAGQQLAISPLLIQLRCHPVVAGQGPPAHTDKLRSFYLDLEQYSLSESSISQMMKDFWSGGTDARPDRCEAFAAAEVIGFDYLPDNLDEVKYRFRRAVMRAHPDRGGNTEEVQVLNEAFSTLRIYFN